MLRREFMSQANDNLLTGREADTCKHE